MKAADKRKSAVVLAVACCLGVLLAALAGLTWFDGWTEAKPDRSVVAEIDGEDVTEELFRWALARERWAVIEPFKQSPDAVVDESFWQHPNEGATPHETVKRRALDAVVRLKAQLRLAEEQGFIADGSFEGLLAERNRENARRANALKAGLPVYGPATFEADDFADFYLGRLTVELKEKLAEDELALTDRELRRHYDEVKDELFRLEGRARFSVVTASYRKDGVESEELKREAAAAIEAASRRLAAGEAATDIAGARDAGSLRSEDGESPALQTTEENFNADTARYYYRTLPQLYELLAAGPPAGTASPVMDDAYNGRYVLAVVIDSEAGGYADFEKSKAAVRQHALESAYTRYVDKLAENAKVITTNIYESLTW